MSPRRSYTLPRLRTDGDSVLLHVRAVPGASRDAVVGLHGEALKVAVSAPPEKGKANARLEAVLARAFGVSPARVRVEAGKASRDKTVRFVGVTLEEMRTVLEKQEALRRKEE